MLNQKSLSRRGFVQLMGTAAISANGLCSSLLPSAGAAAGKMNGFAYVGCSEGMQDDAIEVFAIRSGQWTAIQRVKTDRPASLALSPNKRFLYVVNEIAEYNGLPMGTVEAYTVAADGRLTLLNRQALSLSATMPRHLAVSPDGKTLVVTAQGGGAYNLMQIGEDGTVGRASGILKETGTVTRAAQPQMAIFDQAGRVVSADLGTGLVSVLGTSNCNLEACGRSFLESGSGPRHIALHPSGDALYVAHEDSLLRFDYNAEAGSIGGLRENLTGAGVADGSKTLSVHPSGKFLFACDSDHGVTAVRVDSSSGAMRRAGRHAEEWGRLEAIEISHDGSSLLAINRERGVVLAATIDTATGQIAALRPLVRVNSPKTLAVVYS